MVVVPWLVTVAKGTEVSCFPSGEPPPVSMGGEALPTDGGLPLVPQKTSVLTNCRIRKFSVDRGLAHAVLSVVFPQVPRFVGPNGVAELRGTPTSCHS